MDIENCSIKKEEMKLEPTSPMDLKCVEEFENLTTKNKELLEIGTIPAPDIKPVASINYNNAITNNSINNTKIRQKSKIKIINPDNPDEDRKKHFRFFLKILKNLIPNQLL